MPDERFALNRFVRITRESVFVIQSNRVPWIALSRATRTNRWAGGPAPAGLARQLLVMRRLARTFLWVFAVFAVQFSTWLNSYSGSRLIFDYVYSAPEVDAYLNIQVLREALDRDLAGEPRPFRTGFGGIAPFLAERGFDLIESLLASEMEQTFLTLRDGSLMVRVPSIFGLATAAVC